MKRKRNPVPVGKTQIPVLIPIELAEAARQKKRETGMPISFVVEKFLTWWVAGGDPRTLLPPSETERDGKTD